jgi:hypothetical protein
MYGDIPPCIQKILSETKAATGIQLKHLTKDFHNFIEYFRQPE